MIQAIQSDLDLNFAYLKVKNIAKKTKIKIIINLYNP